MPFTPFHLGPGLLFKAVGSDRFSFMIFGGSQVLMDLEPPIRMIRGDAVLHGLSHTIGGASVIAIVSAAIGRPISNLALRETGMTDPSIGWIVALLSACLGTFSHIGLDAVMHSDMSPLWPFASKNALLGSISLQALHLLCIGAAMIGGTVVGLRAVRNA